MVKRQKSDVAPKFPYSTSPAALRRLLQEIPKRPKPSKLTLGVLKTWKVTSSNDASPISVLKKLGLVGTSGEPLEGYTDFMQPPPTGPRSLGARIKEQYKELFETSHEPQKNPSELRTFFNIHSGGGERTIDYQIQTFKTLTDFADFSGAGEAGVSHTDGDTTGERRSSGVSGKLPPVQIDLHIHLPENKTARDYEAIIQDIAKYIYGRAVTDGA
jgi:hypothetical protein